MTDDYTKAEALRLAKAHLEKMGWKYDHIRIAQVAKEILKELNDQNHSEWNAAIEAAAEVVKPKKERPCDCDGCYCGNPGDAATVAQWDADDWAYSTIRDLKKGSDHD